eukprot:4670863-Pyramimonas_sp.AAC.1
MLGHAERPLAVDRLRQRPCVVEALGLLLQRRDYPELDDYAKPLASLNLSLLAPGGDLPPAASRVQSEVHCNPVGFS